MPESGDFERVLTRLEEAGWFKHVCSERVSEVKEWMLREKSIFKGENQYAAQGRRTYSADGEDLSEGGVLGFLYKASAFLQEESLYLYHMDQRRIANHYSVDVFGKKYVMYRKGEGSHRALVPARTFIMLNEILAKVNSNERVYTLRGTFGGEETLAVFMTPELCAIVNESPAISEEEKPMTAEEALAVSIL